MPKAAKTGAVPKIAPYSAPSTRSSAPRAPSLLYHPPPSPPHAFSPPLPSQSPARLQVLTSPPLAALPLRLGPDLPLSLPLVENDDEEDLEEEEKVDESYGASNRTPSIVQGSLSGPSPAWTDATLVQTPSPSDTRVNLPKRDLPHPNVDLDFGSVPPTPVIKHARPLPPVFPGLDLLAEAAFLTSASTTTRTTTPSQIPTAPSTIGLTLGARTPSTAAPATSGSAPNNRIADALTSLSRGRRVPITVPQNIIALLSLAREALKSLRPGVQSLSASIQTSTTASGDAPARATPPPTVDEDISLHDQDSTIRAEYRHYHYDNDVRDHDEDGSLHDGRYDEEMHDEYSPLDDDSNPLHDENTAQHDNRVLYDEDEDIGVPGSGQGSPDSSRPGSPAEESDEVMEITQEEWEAAEHNSNDQDLAADDPAAAKAYILSVIDDDMEAHERGQLPIRRRKRRIVCSDEEDEGEDEDEEDKEDEDAEDDDETNKDLSSRATSPSTTRAHTDLEPSESSQSPSPEPSAADDIVGAWKRSLQPLVDKFNWIPFTTKDFEEFTKFMLTIKALQDAVTYDDVYKSGLYEMINDIATKKNHGKPADRLVRTAKAVTAWFDANLKKPTRAGARRAGADGGVALGKRKRESIMADVPKANRRKVWVSTLEVFLNGDTRQSRTRKMFKDVDDIMLRLEGCWNDPTSHHRNDNELVAKLRRLAAMKDPDHDYRFAARATALVARLKEKGT